VDKSPAALAVAGTNAAYVAEQVQDQTLTERAVFVESDLYCQLPAGAKFDVVVSNPPYIPSAVIGTLARDVQQEPV
jgi:methylase of polypeptide subunit release factors